MASENSATESSSMQNDATVEIDSVKYDWYEKGTDAIILHVYVKKVTECNLVCSQEEENYVDITFTTSDVAFIKKYCKTSSEESEQELQKFAYRIYPRGNVCPDKKSCIAKKTLIEVCLYKTLPIAWRLLEKQEVTIARQTGKLGEWKKGLYKTQDKGDDSIDKDSIPTTKEPSNGLPDSNSMRHNPKNQIYGKFTTKSQLLGGKSTPISKGEQGNKEKREEAGTSFDDQQPSCSSVEEETSSTLNRQLPVRQEVLGLNGLENFANNCYVNVVVQVLANVIEVKDYFENDSYLQFLNVGNPLGSGGKVAKAFSDLIKLLWSGGKKSYRPSILKNIMGKRCSLFLGFQQCDAQEFFSSLLDNLHEDLNQGKIDRDPEYPSKETDGPTVNERSDTAWHAHLARNNSIIVKMFHGQLVSKLTCASCHKVSHSFDPCAQISLPIAMEKKILNVILFFKDFNKTPAQLRVQISTLNAQVWHLINMVSRKVDIPSHCLKAFPVAEGLYQPSLNDQAPLRPMLDKKYVIVCETQDNDEDYISLPVLQHISGQVEFSRCSFCTKSQDLLTTKLKRCTRCSAVAYCGRDCQSKHWSVHKSECRKDAKLQFGLPFMVTLKKSLCTFKTLRDALLTYGYYSIKDEMCGESFDHSSGSETGNTSKEVTEAVSEATPHVGATSAPDMTESGSSEFVVRAHPQCKTDSEVFVLKQDDFKVEKLYSLSHLSIDWVSSHGSEDKGQVLKERTPPVFVPWDTVPQDEKVTVDKCTLEDCLSLFMEPERLSESESWRCPKCKTPQAARKEMSISYPPPILLLHLKRFTYGEVGQKVSKPIHYRVSGFDLSPYIFEETRALSFTPYLYDLVGVICHKGSLRMGHYVCMTRLLDHNDMEDIGWRFMDDDDITRVREEKVISPEAYVVIYRLRGLNKHLNVERTVIATPTMFDGFNSATVKSGAHKSTSSDPGSESETEHTGHSSESPREVSSAAKSSKVQRQSSEETETNPIFHTHESGTKECTLGVDCLPRSHSYSEEQKGRHTPIKIRRSLSTGEGSSAKGYIPGSERPSIDSFSSDFVTDLPREGSAPSTGTASYRTKSTESPTSENAAANIFVDSNDDEIFSDCVEYFSLGEVKPRKSTYTKDCADVSDTVLHEFSGESFTGAFSSKEATILNRPNSDAQPTTQLLDRIIDQKNVTEDDLD